MSAPVSWTKPSNSRRTSASSASIISSMTTVLPSSNNNRTSLPPLTTGQRAAHAQRNAQCTHLTTTRLFTKDFRCAICYREGSFGWLWRCTQDRELMLDEEVENGYPEQEKLDVLCDIFPMPPVPRKRSPLARSSKLSFLDEISDGDLKTYTPAQVQLILNQRSQLLDILNPVEEHLDLSITSSTTSLSLPRFSFNPFARTVTSLNGSTNPAPNPNLTPVSPRSPYSSRSPWLPAKGTECQFKCCHSCRPTLLDRSFMSLNAIVNGDVPATAITGFGFNLSKMRPVAKAKVVQNLGLRAVPLPRPGRASQKQALSRSVVSKQRRYMSLQNVGLGILTTQPLSDSVSTSTTSTASSSASSSQSPTPSCTPPEQVPANPFIPPFPPRTNTSSEGTSSIASSNYSTPQSEIDPIDIPLPIQTPSEISLLSIPLTPTGMEQTESFGQFFSAQPLEVQDGVAVMEEGVGLHVPDILITQF